jgi:hypothetical protein
MNPMTRSHAFGKNGDSAVKKLSRNKITARPQNRHLKPWKPGQAPKSPGRPRTAHLLRQLASYLKEEHPDALEEYLFEPVGRRNARRKRLHVLLDMLMEKHTVLFCYYVWGPPKPMGFLGTE